MATIYELKIENFRGIKAFSEKFNKKFICLLGRGDSGKTTILDAISFVLSPSWNLSVYDSDFYQGNTDCPIRIETSLLDLHEKFIKEDKYGLYIRGLDANGVIHDELEHDHKKILTVKLEIGKDLEPQWNIINGRQESIVISGQDRAKLNVFMISDYIDRHFSWSRGNPLYSILKETQPSGDEKSDVIIEALREAKEKIDQHSFSHLNDVTDRIKNISSNLGVDLSKAKTTIDFRDVSIKDGRVCLHDGDVPLRLKGKGTKRLISMAIQTVLVEHGGIVLIDEVEQGLEPDRVRHLVRSLKKDNVGQIFLTTHSSEVITELEAEDLAIVNNSDGNVKVSAPKSEFQDIIRACPEAGYAKKVIVCEGKTEVGICRALDVYRKKNNKECMSFKNCVYVIGGGETFTERAKRLKKLGLMVCVFCDSDKDDDLKPTKEDLRKLDIKIFDCDKGSAIEDQIFQDLPWDGIKTLIDYIIDNKKLTEAQMMDSLKSKYDGVFPNGFKNVDTKQMRQALAKASRVKDKEWFKRIDHGEFLGLTIFKFFYKMSVEKIKIQLDDISNWIDG
ncbi:MAG: ATP-binding protein [Patescibacteria group bacterium]|jgi:predicted ATP-dependent endonuclease of OLD family